MKPSQHATTPTSESAPVHASSSTRSVVITAVAVTLVVAYQLYRTAQQTGNYEGMWFSLVHTVLVAVATVIALKPRRIG
jgi:hypothetical protein